MKLIIMLVAVLSMSAIAGNKRCKEKYEQALDTHRSANYQGEYTVEMVKYIALLRETLAEQDRNDPYFDNLKYKLCTSVTDTKESFIQTTTEVTTYIDQVNGLLNFKGCRFGWSIKLDEEELKDAIRGMNSELAKIDLTYIAFINTYYNSTDVDLNCKD
ncbi:hypothetical protein N9B72_01880 [Bacteriovoracaceae bacterium]|nr:hypothetical protein [Bacteriovoracaceae bacterium]